MTHYHYPPTQTGDEFDTAAGVAFPDPYRWLEGEDEAVLRWQAAQSRLADEYTHSWPHLSTLTRSVRQYYADRVDALPKFVAGKWFRTVQMTASEPPVVLVSRHPYGDDHRIVVPITAQECGVPFISWIAPSPDGSIVAVGVCTDGSENNHVTLLQVPSGEALATAPKQMLMDAWTGGVCWLPDSSGFYFLALEDNTRAFRKSVLLHRVASGEQFPSGIPLPDPDSPDYTLVSASPDGRYLVASHGLFAPKPVAIRDLHDACGLWRPFVNEAAGTIVGCIMEDALIAITDIDAPRGRIVRIPLNASNPNDSSQWSQVLAESEVVLRSLTPIGHQLYVTGFVDTYSHLRILDLRRKSVKAARLPGRGAIAEPLFPLMTLIPSGHPAEFHFVFSSLTQSWGVYKHRPSDDTVETIRAPEVCMPDAVIEDRWAVSADGVRVPYHTVRLASADQGPLPALIYAYGAFNIPLLPEYPGGVAAFIAAGGLYVHGHIRGGAELGLQWWRSGRMENKQNCFRDLYAIAEDLIKQGLSTSSRLAMTGRSNGGLMAGVAVTQRPELWRAVVAQVPVLDLIGVLRDPYGSYALAKEYADPTIPEEVTRLAGFSPYHLVKNGSAYPAVFITAGATDPRCPAWHARKFAARLQAATAADGVPIVLRVRENAGHGPANAQAVQIDGTAEWLAFVMRELQMVPQGEMVR